MTPIFGASAAGDRLMIPFGGWMRQTAPVLVRCGLCLGLIGQMMNDLLRNLPRFAEPVVADDLREWFATGCGGVGTVIFGRRRIPDHDD